MNIIFFGSDPWFSPPVLEAILKAGHEVLAIVTKGEMRNEFNKLIELNKLKTLIIEGKNQADISLSRLTNNELRVTSRPLAIILAAFGPPFLSKEVLNWPKYGCLNVHASLLPRWRGASPVFGAIANDDEETGVSIMRMTEEIDLGPILGQKRTVLSGRGPSSLDTRESLTRRLGILGGKLIVETLKKLQNGQINEIKQPSKSPTFYTHRLTKESGRIDWRFRPGETDLERSRRIERFIRAATPWPGAFTSAKFKVQSSKWQTIPELKILKAHLEPIQYSVFSIQYSLIIDFVQLPGKNPISWKQFLAGHPGAKLE